MNDSIENNELSENASNNTSEFTPESVETKPFRQLMLVYVLTFITTMPLVLSGVLIFTDLAHFIASNPQILGFIAACFLMLATIGLVIDKYPRDKWAMFGNITAIFFWGLAAYQASAELTRQNEYPTSPYEGLWILQLGFTWLLFGIPLIIVMVPVLIYRLVKSKARTTDSPEQLRTFKVQLSVKLLILLSLLGVSVVLAIAALLFSRLT